MYYFCFKLSKKNKITFWCYPVEPGLLINLLTSGEVLVRSHCEAAIASGMGVAVAWRGQGQGCQCVQRLGSSMPSSHRRLNYFSHFALSLLAETIFPLCIWYNYFFLLSLTRSLFFNFYCILVFHDNWPPILSRHIDKSNNC